MKKNDKEKQKRCEGIDKVIERLEEAKENDEPFIVSMEGTLMISGNLPSILSAITLILEHLYKSKTIDKEDLELIVKLATSNNDKNELLKILVEVIQKKIK